MNLFKLLSGALALNPGRRVILTEDDNFPTDLYIAEGVAALFGADLRRVPADAVADAVDERVAVVSLTHVSYRTGRMHDLAQVTARAHAAGALMLWDLAHSAGAMPIDVNACGVDLAVGCGYKYLNGGPGAPAFLFIAERHQAAFRRRCPAGWATPTRSRSRRATAPPTACPRALRHAADPEPCRAGGRRGLCAREADSRGVRRKDGGAVRDVHRGSSRRECAAGLRLTSPRDAAQRGSQVCFAHAEGYAVMQALIARGVIGDFRAPDILRFGFAPLYVRFADVGEAVRHLREVLERREWDRPEFRQRATVT